MKKSYCTQNDGDCETCSLVNYGHDCQNEKITDGTKTAKQMADEIRASSTEYVTYGESDLGIPIKREDAIRDIESMDDEQIGPGTWFECDASGAIAETH